MNKILQVSVKFCGATTPIITFHTKDNIKIGDIISIFCRQQELSFRVTSINTSVDFDDYVVVEAIEAGYCNKFYDINNPDIRLLLKKEVKLVTDKEKIKQIDKQSTWL